MKSLAVLTSLLALATPAAGEEPPPGKLYRGEVTLPVPLRTTDGAALEKGKLRVEVRLEKEQHVLAFYREEQLVAQVPTQPEKKDEKERENTVPLVGTIRLERVDPPESARNDGSQLAQYLRGRSWRATLRVYGHEDPATKAVRFVFSEQVKPGAWLRREFVLERGG